VVPAGFSGSITHKPILGAALACAFEGAHVGVDVEILERPRADIGKRVLTERERAAAGEDAIELMARFSLKEAIYKAVDRYVQRYVGFLEAEFLSLPPAPPSASWAEAQFVDVDATLLMANGEGPFVVEATWARVDRVCISTARVRPRDEDTDGL
jgi:4'-phosphopantetheinyl transferase EntD